MQTNRIIPYKRAGKHCYEQSVQLIALYHPVGCLRSPIGVHAPELKVGVDDVGVAHADGAKDGEVVEAFDARQSLLHRQLVLEGFHVDLWEKGSELMPLVSVKCSSNQ